MICLSSSISRFIYPISLSRITSVSDLHACFKVATYYENYIWSFFIYFSYKSFSSTSMRRLAWFSSAFCYLYFASSIIPVKSCIDVSSVPIYVVLTFFYSSRSFSLFLPFSRISYDFFSSVFLVSSSASLLFRSPRSCSISFFCFEIISWFVPVTVLNFVSWARIYSRAFSRSLIDF